MADSHGNAYTKGVAEEIVAAIASPDVTTVNVSRQYIGIKGAKDVAAAIVASSTLRKLVLSRLLLLTFFLSLRCNSLKALFSLQM